MIGYWNEDEDSALQGLSLEAQVIYLRGIRRFADKNGIAGIERRINRASLSEVCHFLPDRRSPRAETRPSWDSVKHRLAELERAGLIVRLENLVFELPLAVQDKSGQMKTAGRRPVSEHPKTAPKTAPETARPEELQDNGFAVVDGTQDGTQDAPVDTPPNSRVDGTTPPITAFTTSTTARKAETGHRRAFAMTLDWKPSDMFDQRAKPQGVDPALLTPFMLAAFVSHNEANGCTNNQGQWENLLVRWIKREQGSPQVAASPERHARPSSPHQPINAITDPNAYVLPLLQPRKEKEIPAEERQRQLAELRRMKGTLV